MAKISSNELKWQAEEDARTLVRYQEIIGDSGRKNRAIKEATRQANDLEKRLKTMREAGSKIKRK